MFILSLKINNNFQNFLNHNWKQRILERKKKSLPNQCTQDTHAKASETDTIGDFGVSVILRVKLQFYLVIIVPKV